MLTVKRAKEVLQAETPVAFMNDEYIKINENKCKRHRINKKGEER